MIPQTLQDAMRAAGYEPPPMIETDKFTRFSTKKASKKDGFCKQFADGRAGIFGEWVTGQLEVWRAHPDAMSQSELAEFRRQCEEQRRLAAELLEGEQCSAAMRAAEIWKSAPVVPESHPYLVKKRIKPNGAKLAADGRLLIAVTGIDGIQSLQYITGEGEKRFLPGAKKKGGWFAIGELARIFHDKVSAEQP